MCRSYEKNYEAALEERKRQIKEQQEEYEKMQEEYRKRNKKRLDEAETVNKALNSFPVSSFGIWNCDIASRLPVISLKATFKDEKGKVLDLTEISIIVRSRNSILKVSPANMMIVPGTDNMILSAYFDKLYYINFEEFRKLNITAETTEQTFIMKVVEEPNNNYDYIKSLYNP